LTLLLTQAFLLAWQWSPSSVVSVQARQRWRRHWEREVARGRRHAARRWDETGRQCSRGRQRDAGLLHELDELSGIGRVVGIKARQRRWRSSVEAWQGEGQRGRGGTRACANTRNRRWWDS
jgi:hypothetical protein